MTKHLFIALPLLLVAALFCAGCGDGIAAQSSSIPTSYVCFIDISVSADSETGGLWGRAAEELIFNKLKPGDSVLIYAVSDKTAESAPLFDKSIPALGEDDGQEREIFIRRELAETRTKGLESVRLALRASVRSRQTRLLDSIARVPRDPGRKKFVLYLTDALESAPELDLERARLTDQNRFQLVQAAVDRHGWRNGMLAGAAVQFVLDSPRINDKPPINNHRALEAFWRLVFTSLGAELKAFDSRIVTD